VSSVGDGGHEAYTAIVWGWAIEPRNRQYHRGRDLPSSRRQHVRHRYARCWRSVVVEDPITHKGNTPEPPPLRGQALGDLVSDRVDLHPPGPRREGEEP